MPLHTLGTHASSYTYFTAMKISFRSSFFLPLTEKTSFMSSVVNPCFQKSSFVSSVFFRSNCSIICYNLNLLQRSIMLTLIFHFLIITIFVKIMCVLHKRKQSKRFSCTKILRPAPKVLYQTLLLSREIKT